MMNNPRLRMGHPPNPFTSYAKGQPRRLPSWNLPKHREPPYKKQCHSERNAVESKSLPLYARVESKRCILESLSSRFRRPFGLHSG
jgi:hypothetical protein